MKELDIGEVARRSGLPASTLRYDELDRTIERLSAIRDELRRVASCPAARHIECSKFQKMLNAIGTGDIKRKTGKGDLRRRG